MNLLNTTLAVMITGLSLIASTANADDVTDMFDSNVFGITVYATPASHYEFPPTTIMDYQKKWQSGVLDVAISTSQYKFAPITILDYVKKWQSRSAT